MTKPIIKIENLHYAYEKEAPVLQGVNMEIKAGEKIAIMGANGSGKSTFFLNLNGVFTPHEGFIRYRDKVINKKNIKELRRNIGIVFQNADDQIIASTVGAEVGFGPMNLKLPKEEVKQRVQQALRYMNLTQLEASPPHCLSGGEKKRVSIADIIAMESEIMIFDEPTASLDPANEAMLKNVLETLHAQGKTLLLSIHDVDFAYEWADRVVVFHEGKIIGDDTPLHIFRNAELLKQSNLKQPVMLEVYETLVKANIIKDTAAVPRNIKQLEAVLTIVEKRGEQ